MKRRRILLADDHAMVLAGFRAVIEPHHEVVEAVTDGRSLVEAALRLKPDLIVLDITLPLLNGIEAARQLKKSVPETKLLFVTMHANPAYLQAALEAGATGYVLKSSAREEILTAIGKVLKGKIHVTPGLSGRPLERFQDPAEAADSLRLNAREREVLQMIAAGQVAKGIAGDLKISVKMVAVHRENIKRKLGLRATAELTKYAIQQWLV